MNQIELAQKFDQAMMGIYNRAWSEAKYKATLFLSMLHQHGGLETARRLIHSKTVSDGYTALWERKRLDLTLEALIVENDIWHPLFTEDELNICKQRLQQYKYTPKIG